MTVKKIWSIYVLMLLGMFIMFTGCFVGKDEGGKEESEIEMVYVKAGTTSVENGNITVSQSFYIGKYEVTQSEWEMVMSGNVNGISTTPSYYGVNPNNPVESISWYDVLVFCNRLSIKEGLRPVYSISGSTNPDSWGTAPTSMNPTWDGATVNTLADGYRLPSEIEWEYAARGGSTGSKTEYVGSDTIEEVAWYWDNNTTNGEKYGTKAVGRKQSNELGIYDMSGNVWEWCYDWYSGYEGSWRVLRGGSWINFAVFSMLASRDFLSPDCRDYSSGFRIARKF